MVITGCIKPYYKCVLETFGANLWAEANLATQIMLLGFRLGQNFV